MKKSNTNGTWLARLLGLSTHPVSRRERKMFKLSGYKPAFSCGYRGLPRMSTPCGATPAPTLDQVRDRERKYGHRIHVKRGLMFFKSDGIMWTKEEAQRRLDAQLAALKPIFAIFQQEGSNG